MNCKNNSIMTKKKAFTLIELLIVIAIIGILFIVLVSKVDFATDKAKGTGVQTDFRSFQMAFETVSKEKAGFNSFGWNTGDANANGVRDSVDEGDANEDGIYQDGETWTGHKKYLETWTNRYSLIRPGTTFEADGYDKDAIFALETAINKNLDPTLQITIDAKTGLITMANGAQDPWNTQYHGAYISAEDGMDRGAIVMYSNGANQKFGSEHDIANGVPTVIVPGNNKDGADDYSLVVCYTYTNGYGETAAMTEGFSNDQQFLTGNTVALGGNGGTLQLPAENPTGNLQDYFDSEGWSSIKALAQANLSKDDYKNKYGIEPGDTIVSNGATYVLVDLGCDDDGDGVRDNYAGFVFMYNSGVKKQMNPIGSNEGGYGSYAMDQVDLLYNSLDGDLQSVIKDVKITYNEGNSAYNTTPYHTTIEPVHLFLASYKEVGFIKDFDDKKTDRYYTGYYAEGTRFDYFLEGAETNARSKRRELCSSDWWLRSTDSSTTYGFYYVTIGAYTRGNTSSSYAVVPCFVIG